MSVILIISGCSTANMEKKIREQRAIDIEKYAYEDEEFVYKEALVQELADRFRLEELTIQNVNSIMKDEIKAGNFNEVIIIIRHLLDNEEETGILYIDRLHEAMNAHVQRVSQPSPTLLTNAIEIAKERYERDPEDPSRVIQYANMLINSERDVQGGIELLYDLEQQFKENEQEPGQQSLQSFARAYFIDGKYDKSLVLYTKLTTLNPDDPMLYYNMSQVLLAMGAEDLARETMQKAFGPTQDFLNHFGTDDFTLYKDYFNLTTASAEE